MRNLLLVGWLALPIGAWAYHEGPGQDRVALESMDAVVVAAQDAATAGKWKEAVRQYEAALAKLPKNPDAIGKSTVQRLRVELNKARMKANKLPDAREELESLVEELQGETGTDPAVLADARQALARSQYYMTWLMRLEGLDRDAWEPEIEAARQNWRLLAEQSQDGQVAAVHKKDLESAIQLERIELEDLQGLPLPGE